MNVPTWTGRHGESGADTVVRRFGGPSRGGPSPLGLGNANYDHFGGATAGVSGGGAAPSSAALLAHLRSRQQQVDVVGLTAASNAAPAAQEVCQGPPCLCTCLSAVVVNGGHYSKVL